MDGLFEHVACASPFPIPDRWIMLALLSASTQAKTGWLKCHKSYVCKGFAHGVNHPMLPSGVGFVQCLAMRLACLSFDDYGDRCFLVVEPQIAHAKKQILTPLESACCMLLANARVRPLKVLDYPTKRKVRAQIYQGHLEAIQVDAEGQRVVAGGPRNLREKHVLAPETHRHP